MSGFIVVRHGSYLGLRLRARSKWHGLLVILAAIAAFAALAVTLNSLDPLFQVPTTTTYITPTGNVIIKN